jgi:hypothetical protein
MDQVKLIARGNMLLLPEQCRISLLIRPEVDDNIVEIIPLKLMYNADCPGNWILRPLSGEHRLKSWHQYWVVRGSGGNYMALDSKHSLEHLPRSPVRRDNVIHLAFSKPVYRPSGDGA